jgi:uncharacterized protein
MRFVQADPIRAPARAQDLILRHRVKNYHAGDLERRYVALDIEEDFFVNYGYVTRSLQRLMHSRSKSRVPADIGEPWSRAHRRQAKLLLDFVRVRGPVHPRQVDEYFAPGKVTNYWGGSSNATTHLLNSMHYLGLLRVVRREKGIRIWAVHEHEKRPSNASVRRAGMDSLVDIVVDIYGPLSAASLSSYVGRLRFAAPQWRAEIKNALARAKERLAHACVDRTDWYWNADDNELLSQAVDERVRLLAPFDPVVHDRARFEQLWGWTYRLEAYTPAAKRKLGYYAMPLLWRERVIGWANVSLKGGKLAVALGYVDSEPSNQNFRRALEAELENFREFLGV